MDEGYQALANAIIVQACKDYRRAVLILRDKPNDLFLLTEKEKRKYEHAAKTIKQVRKFFKSQYFTHLTKVDPNYLWEILNKDIEDYE